MSSVAERLQQKSKRKSPAKQVRLKLVYIDFWSAVKLSFLLAVCLGVVLIVATFLVWIVLDSTGIFKSMDELLSSILTQPDFHITDSFGLGPVTMFAAIVAILNIIVGTALGAVVAMLYNFSVRVTGGLLIGFSNN